MVHKSFSGPGACEPFTLPGVAVRFTTGAEESGKKLSILIF